MPAETKEMTEARALLAKFEADMHKAEGIVHLSDALALLADVRDAGDSGQSATIASNIALAYARKIQRVLELLGRETIVHADTVAHWNKVCEEFEQAGFPLPPEVTAARSTLLLKKMSPSERQTLLRRRQALDDGKD